MGSEGIEWDWIGSDRMMAGFAYARGTWFCTKGARVNTTPPSDSAQRRNPIFAIFLTVFIDLLGFGILIPVFPLLISPGSPFRVTPQAWSFATGLIMLGWLQAVFPFCSFIAAPILGQLSDRFGRRPILALSVAGTACGYVLFTLGIVSKNIPLLFLARALDGFTGGNIAVAQAAIGDISTHQNRAKNFGVIGAAFGLGFIIGPYIGGRLSAPHASVYGLFTTPEWFGATTPFWFAALLSALNCLLILWIFPETHKNKDTNRSIDLAKSVSNVVRGFTSPRLRIPLVSAFFFNAGFTFFTSYFGVYLASRFGYTQSDTGDFFAVVGLFISFAQGVIVGKVAKRLPDYKVLRFSMFAVSAVLGVYFIVNTTWPLYATIPVFTVFNGLTMANTGSLISRSAEPGRQGEASGIYSGVQNLAQVPASALIGYVAGSVAMNAPLVAASGFIFLAGIIFVLRFKPTFVSDTTVRTTATTTR
jgi:MFS transporter, DHA1 family, tetracycline resistance protein